MERHRRKSHIHHYFSRSSKAHRWIIVALLLISLFNLGWLGLRTASAYRLKQKYVSAMGVVVDITQQKSTSNVEKHYPVVEFQTPEGKTVIFKDQTGSNEPQYQPGQMVPILYHKEKPYVALVDTQTQN